MPAPSRLLSMRNPLARTLLLAVVVLVLLALTFRSQPIDVSARLRTGSKQTAPVQQPLEPAAGSPDVPKTDAEGTTTPHIPNCDVDTAHLREIKELFKLDDKFQYMKRYVKFKRAPIPRRSITNLDQKFLNKKFKTVDVRKKYGHEACAEPLEVEVPESPFPAAANASDFIFAVSTTYKRFNETKTSPVNEWKYWLTDDRGSSNGGKLILLLLEASESELLDATNRLRGVGIDVDVYHSDASKEMAVRYLSLVPKLYKHPASKNRKWLVTCDDDTYFPSMNGLIAKMATFDHTQPLYVGTLSEDVNAIDRHGSQAFGGAGVFLSVPMAAKLTSLFGACTTDQKIQESNSGWGPQGDLLLRKCIYENTEVRLTNVWDLWQLDLLADPAGFYESGIQPLSLHHFKGGGWHLARPWDTSKVAHACGEACSYLRFRTTDDFILSNGFSVAHYPRGIDFDLGQVERTFAAAPEDKGWNFDFKMGPQRRALHKTGRKIAWELSRATVNPDGSVLQTYTRKNDDWRWTDDRGNRMNKVDGVIELVWVPS